MRAAVGFVLMMVRREIFSLVFFFHSLLCFHEGLTRRNRFCPAGRTAFLWVQLQRNVSSGEFSVQLFAAPWWGDGVFTVSFTWIYREQTWLKQESWSKCVTEGSKQKGSDCSRDQLAGFGFFASFLANYLKMVTNVNF